MSASRVIWRASPRSMAGIGTLIPGEDLPDGVPPDVVRAWLAQGYALEVKSVPRRKTSRTSTPPPPQKSATADQE